MNLRPAGLGARHGLCLEQLTVWGASPQETVRIAADLGCDAVSLWVQSAGDGCAAPPLIEDRGMRAETKAAIRDTGLRVRTIECFVIAPDTVPDHYRPALAVGSELGCEAATAIVFDDNRDRATGNFGRLAAQAREFGIALNVEFLAFSPVPDLGTAGNLVREAGVVGCGVVIDSLHLYRSGGTPADVLAFDPSLIGMVQICDGPATMPTDLQPYHEGFEQRVIPGKGRFPLVEFVRSLPGECLIGPEVPLKNLADRGVPPAERARRVIAATRGILARAMAAA